MDDWQVGDLALCVSFGPDAKHWLGTPGGPALGSIHVVDDLDYDEDGLWLHFSEWPEDGFFCLAFRKIRPLTDEERDSFLADLDEPITPARRVAPVGAALNARVGHLSPLACPASTLPDPSAANAPCRAGGPGFSDLRFHEARNV